MMFDDNSPSR